MSKYQFDAGKICEYLTPLKEQQLIGYGNTISLIRNGDSAVITFSIGRGDCYAGCGYLKCWKFKVLDGIAKFVGTY